MTKNSAKTNLLFENFTMDAAFDLDLAYPSEEDFTFVKKAKAEYTNKGHNAEAQYRPDVLAIVMTNKNRIIRVLVASILLGWNDMVQAMKAAFERLGGSNDELKGIINEIIANRSRISGFNADEKEEEPEEAQSQQTNSGLDIRVDSQNAPINFRRIILYDNRYSPAARRHYIVGKKDANGKYKIVIRGSDVGPSYEYKYYDTVFFDSDTQAEAFINRAITDINTTMPLSSFTYKITSKGINMGSTQINDLHDCVLVNTICGPAYIYRNARNCVESLQEKIVQLNNGDWQVQSEKGRNMGTYDTKKEAEKRLGQVEYFKHMNEEVDKDLETKVRNIIKDFSDENNSKLSILEYNDGYDGFKEKFDDKEIDFGVFTLNKLSDKEIEDGKPVITFLLSGGLNGSGDWIDYLNDTSELFKQFEKELGLHAIVYKINTDIPDDVWTAEILLYVTPKEEVKEDVEKHPAKKDIFVKLINRFKDDDYSMFDLKALLKSCTVTKKQHTESEINLIAKFDNKCKVIEETEKGYLISVPVYFRNKEDRSKINDTPEYFMAWAPKQDCVLLDNLEEDVEKHDHLNPKLFDNNHLKPEVRQKCMEIVDFFLKQLEEDEVKIDVKDIIFTGSNASYNYTKDSDIDLHIIADTSNFECPDNLYPKLYNAYKSLFNSKFDVSFYGIPVEIYVETGDTPLISNGIYSIKNDAWEQEPTETTIPEIDWNEFMKVYQPWEDEYKELVNSIDPETATDDKPIDDFITKVYELRHTGLANEGQYGFSNLIFKELRNRGHLQELKDLKNEVIANRLTLEALTEAANMDEKTRHILRNKIGQVSHNQPIIQTNGLFQIFNVKADEVDYIIRELQRLDLVEFVSKTASKYDFSKINFDGMPSRYYTISGKVKI